MYYYIAYGLSIHSDLQLPELVAITETQRNLAVQPNITIRFGNGRHSLPETDQPEGCFHMTAKEAHFFWKQVGALRVRNGEEIIIESLPGVEEGVIRQPLVGIVLSALLQQRKLLALHASANTLNGGAVVFLGSKGRGKSTIAATLYARGHALVGDDLVAVDTDGLESPIVFPGAPHLKLMPEIAANTLGDDPTQLPQLISGSEKRARCAMTGFSPKPLPLKRLYVLSEGPTLEIELLRPQEAILYLIGHAWYARFKQFFRGREASLNFLQCAEIAKLVPIYRLQRPNALSLMPSVAQLVEEHNQ